MALPLSVLYTVISFHLSGRIVRAKHIRSHHPFYWELSGIAPAQFHPFLQDYWRILFEPWHCHKKGTTLLLQIRADNLNSGRLDLPVNKRHISSFLNDKLALLKYFVLKCIHALEIQQKS